MTQLKHYSGDNSKDFWAAINSLEGAEKETMYSMGVRLQNLESVVLKELKESGYHKKDELFEKLQKYENMEPGLPMKGLYERFKEIFADDLNRSAGLEELREFYTRQDSTTKVNCQSIVTRIEMFISKYGGKDG